MRRQIMACNPVNLNQFVVDLRSRHLGFWGQYSSPDPRDTNCRRLTYHQWCALPTREAHAIHPPFTVPEYMFLDIPKEVLRNTARFRMRVHTLKIEKASWSPSLYPICDCCDTGDIQDENTRCSDVLILRSAPSDHNALHSMNKIFLFYDIMPPSECL